MNAVPQLQEQPAANNRAMIHCSSLPPFTAIGELASKRMSGASRKVLFSYHPPYRHTVPPSACLSSPPAPFGTSLACVSLSPVVQCAPEASSSVYILFEWGSWSRPEQQPPTLAQSARLQ